MAYFTRDEIRDIKAGVTNADFRYVAAYYGIPIKKGSILCPFHNDQHYGSAVLGNGRNSAYCFVCNRSISVFDLIMEKEGVEFKEAVHIYWCRIKGNPEPEERKKPKKWRPNWKALSFIGLGASSDCRIIPMNMVERMERNELPKGWDYDRNYYDEEQDSFACGPMAKQMSLYSLEPQVYWDIIRGKAKESIETREKRLQEICNPYTREGRICYMYPAYGRELYAKLMEELAYAKNLAAKIERASA